jgi:hypothetical protein
MPFPKSSAAYAGIEANQTFISPVKNSRERVEPYVCQFVAPRRETGKIGALTISVTSS